jgi:hypothetical protein
MPDGDAGGFRPHRHIRATLTVQGGMLLDLRGRGRWFALTPSAALWWQRIQGGASLSEAASAVAQRYGLTVERAGHDLQPFIDEVLQRRMLVPAGSPRRWRPW